MKRALRCIVGLLLSPIILFVLLTALLYVPPVQDWAVNTAARLATRGTGFNVSVEHVGLTFPLDIDIRRVNATDSTGDTLLDVERIVLDLDLVQLVTGQVGIDKLTLERGWADTRQLIEGFGMKARIERFAVTAPTQIDLKAGIVQVGGVEAERCDFDIAIGTSEPDTTQQEPLDWDIGVRRVQLGHIGLHLAMDSLNVTADIEHASTRDVLCRLALNEYSAARTSLQGKASVCMAALAADTIELGSIDIGIGKAFYSPTRMTVDRLMASLCHSEIQADAELSLCDPDSFKIESLAIDTKADVGRADIMTACALLGIDTTLWHHAIPEQALGIELAATMHDDSEQQPANNARGPMQRVCIKRSAVNLPTVIEARLQGDGLILNDTTVLQAHADYQIQTHNLAIVRALAGLGRDVRLPRMTLDGSADIDHRQYAAKARLAVAGRDAASLQADFNDSTERYHAQLLLHDLRLRQFLPNCPIDTVGATLRAEGRGTNYLSPATRLDARVEITRCRMDSIDLSDLCLTANYLHRRAALLLDFNNPMLTANFGLNAKVERRDSLAAQFTLDLSHIDLHALGVSDRPLQLGGTVHFDGTSNLTDHHHLKGGLRDIALAGSDTVMHPKDLYLDMLLTPDTMAAHASSGDLHMGVTGSQGVERLLQCINAFMDEVRDQTKDYRIDQEALRLLLPTVTMNIDMGRQNPVANVARMMGYTLNDASLRIDARPDVGLNGDGHINTLGIGAITLDTITWHIYQDTTGVKMNARVCNGPRNPQITFDAQANAYVLPTGAGMALKYFDERGRCGVDLGTRIDILPNGARMRLTPLRPIVAYRHFAVNDSNYVFLSPSGHVEADLDLLADDETRLNIYSTPAADSTTLQDITVSLHHLNVGELCSVMPYMPALNGLLYGDAHLLQTATDLSLALDARIDKFTYEGTDVGNVGLNATYLPMSDSCHCVSALLTLDDNEIATIDGTYTDDGADGLIEASAELTAIPLEVAGRLAGDTRTLGMGGFIDGNMSLSGSTAAPVVDGYISTRSMFVTSPAYNVTLRVQDDTIRVERNRLSLDRIDIYSTGKRPLTMDGTVDFRQLDNIKIDARLAASRFELINAKRNANADAYGKVIVDADATLRGNLQNLLLQGRLGVLGGTDVTYILQDSPLTVEDRLAELVTFTDFADTLKHEAVEEAPPLNLTMRVQLNIEESAQVHCLLSADRSSYVDIEGGGELVMGYSPQGDITLAGRYTITRGEMKYALPVIPLKTFKLQNGSYVAWNGNMLNPTLNIAATERMRSAVADENGQNRTVAFDVGLAITQTLENMGLAFTIEAPEDATVAGELATMDPTTRGRVAVTMLATGIYVTDNGTTGFSTTSALNTFLQSEIAGIAGKALNTVDINVGVEEGTSASGASTTDYSFSFAKRFWNNRISVSFGGKVSSGSDAENTGATIIDNVSLEYRLDNSATRYVRLAYDKKYESLLEGTITEMGAGLVLRRKTTRLGELFVFRRKSHTGN